jgi:SAM-dependent methyltransferase
MSTTYLRRVFAGDVPTPDEWNEHLIAFHGHFENVTCGPMSVMRSDAGETSYQVLARRAHELAPGAGAVLDIGCGEGLLLRKLRRLYGERTELAGIDLSEAEIGRARAMLDHATFICGDARTTDLGTERFDMIVSHLTFMIAAQPNRILQRARRALRTGGVMIAVLEEIPLHPSVARILAAATSALRADHKRFAPVIPERARFEDDAELRTMLAASGFSSAELERYEVRGRFTRAEIWAFVQRVYPYGLLSAPLRDRVHYAVDGALTGLLAADGRTEIVFPLRLIVARD